MPAMGRLTIAKESRPSRRIEGAPFATAPTTLTDVQFTATQQRVPALLFSEPGRSFYASELINRIGAGSGAVQHELKRLAESGLVTVKRIDNQKHYQANPDSPVYAELCGVVQKAVGPPGGQTK